MQVPIGGNFLVSPSAGLPPLANPALAQNPEVQRILSLSQGALSVSGSLPRRFRDTVQAFVARFMSLPAPDAKDIQYAGEKLQAAIDICTAVRAQLIVRGMTNPNVAAGYYESDAYDPLGPAGSRFEYADALTRATETGFDTQVVEAYQRMVGLLGVFGVDKLRPPSQTPDAVGSLQALIDRSFSQ